MFKKGQLVRCTISHEYYIVLDQIRKMLAVRSVSWGCAGFMDVRYVTLIGNNYTAKDSKESESSGRES
ncbi:hypothetical protein [Salmonella phage vB_SalS_JNS02]